MARIIEIEGNLLRIVERDVIETYPADQAIGLLENRPPILLPILPRNNIRALYWNESDFPTRRGQMLIELPAATRTLEYDGAPDDHMRVALPYTIFSVAIGCDGANPRPQDWAVNDIRVYFCKEPLTDLNQWVIPALLQNVYDDARVCWGDTGVPATLPMADRIDKIVNDFYLSRFTNHHVRTYAWPWAGRNEERWVRETTANPTCWKDWPEWDRTDTHVQHLQAKDIFNHPVDRTTPITLTDGIPALQFNPTFGRAEEWLNGLTNVQRFRLATAIENVRTERPTAFAPAAEAAP